MSEQQRTRWTKNGTMKVQKQNDTLGGKPEVRALHEARPSIDTDSRVKLIKSKQHLVLPNLNQFYDTLGTPSAWRNCADGIVSGTITTAANAAVTAPLKVAVNSQWKLSNWPGSVQLFPVVRFFSACVQGAITTAGAISAVYIDQSGIQVPLGTFLSNGSYTNTNETLVPSPITDVGNVNIGNLQFTLNGSTPSTGTYNFQLGIAVAYLLPAQKGYTVHEYDHWQEEYRLYERHPGKAD